MNCATDFIDAIGLCIKLGAALWLSSRSDSSLPPGAVRFALAMSDLRNGFSSRGNLASKCPIG